ncbi:MAG: PH domain-containing protein [Chloroflexi bacterium]|nr:PH domain-containing protein [Chloroflexota bacterium]
MKYVQQLLGENEQVVLSSRQSWVVLLRDVLINLVIAVVILGVTFVAYSLAPTQGFLLGLLLLIPAGRFVIEFSHWFSREYIVTNRRVIQVDGVINKNVIDSSLEKVNDVRMTQSVIGRLLNYGDVEILTASELGTNMFRRIGNPIKFKTAMLNEKEKLGFGETPAGAPAPASAPTPTQVPALIASLNAMRQEGLITEEEYQKKKAELLARM